MDCKENQVKIVDALLHHSRSRNLIVNPALFTCKPQHRKNIFMLACENGLLVVVDTILNCEAFNQDDIVKWFKADAWGDTGFDLACINECVDILKALLDSPRTKDLITVQVLAKGLLDACYHGKEKAFYYLASLRDCKEYNSLFDHDVFKKKKSGKSGFIIACEQGYVDFVKYLINPDFFDEVHIATILNQHYKV